MEPQFQRKVFLSPVSLVHQVNFWVFLVLKTSFPHYILQRGPHRWGFHTKNFAVFPCVSSFANANVAIVFVLCSACPIVLTRPADAGRLKEKKGKWDSSRTYAINLSPLFCNELCSHSEFSYLKNWMSYIFSVWFINRIERRL